MLLLPLFLVLEKANSRHYEYLLNYKPQLIVTLVVIQILVHTVKFLHEKHRVKAPSAVIFEHVEHNVLAKSGRQVLLVEVGLRITLVLEDFGVNCTEV